MRQSDFDGIFRQVVVQHELKKESINSVENLKMELERSFRQLAFICHPDKVEGTDAKSEADRKFKVLMDIKGKLFAWQHAEFLEISFHKWKEGTLFLSNEDLRARQGGSNSPELTRRENSFSRPVKQTLVAQFLELFELTNNQGSSSLLQGSTRSLVAYAGNFSEMYAEFFNRIAWDFVNGTEEHYNGFIEFLKKVCSKPDNLSSGAFIDVLTKRLRFLFEGLTSAKAMQDSPFGFARLAELSKLFSSPHLSQRDLDSPASRELVVVGSFSWISDLWDPLVERLLNESIVNAIKRTLTDSRYQKEGVSFYKAEFSGSLLLNLLKNCQSDLAITLVFDEWGSDSDPGVRARALGSLIAKSDNETAMSLLHAVKNFVDHHRKDGSKVFDMRMDAHFLVLFFATIDYSVMTSEFKDLAVVTMKHIGSSGMDFDFDYNVLSNVNWNDLPNFLTLYSSNPETLALSNLTVDEMQRVKDLLANTQAASNPSHYTPELLKIIKDVVLQDAAYKKVKFQPNMVNLLKDLINNAKDGDDLAKDRADLSAKIVTFYRLEPGATIGNKFICALEFGVRTKDTKLLEHAAEIFITLDSGVQKSCLEQVNELIEAVKVKDVVCAQKILVERIAWDHVALYREYLQICAETGYRPLPDSFIANPKEAIAQVKQLVITGRAADAPLALVADSSEQIKATHESFKREMSTSDTRELKKSTKEKFVGIVTQWIDRVDCAGQSSVEQLINKIERLCYIFSEIENSPVLKAETGVMGGLFGTSGNTDSYNKVITQLKEKMKTLRENYVIKAEKTGRAGDMLEKIDRVLAARSTRFDGVVARFSK